MDAFDKKSKDVQSALEHLFLKSWSQSQVIIVDNEKFLKKVGPKLFQGE